MWLEIFKFEIKYRLKRPATYIYFFIFLICAILLISTKTIQKFGAAGLVKENAPMVLSLFMVRISLFFSLIISAVMGVAIIRDYDHNIAPILFSTPINKTTYLTGRFLGSFVIVVLISSSILFGAILGSWVPWRDPGNLLPFHLADYVRSFGLFILPSIFFMSVIFFSIGALTKKVLVVYTQGILFLVLFIAAQAFIKNMDNRILAAIIDPFGNASILEHIKYWTIAERNSLSIPFTGTILINRMIWIGIAISVYIFTLNRFSFTMRLHQKKKASATNNLAGQSVSQRNIPKVHIHYSWYSSFRKIASIALFHARSVFKEVAFWAIIASGVGLLLIKSINIGIRFGISVYPTTSNVLEALQVFSLFFFIILIFYSAELIWRERNLKIDQINDTLPIPDSIGIIGKFFSLTIIYSVLLLALMVIGIIIQAANGYFKFEIGLYLKTLFSETFFIILFYTFMSFFIQALVNHKFLGYAILIIILSIVDFFPDWGLEHSMFQFGDTSMGVHSDMNKYGHFVNHFVWSNLYWAGFSVIIFIIGMILSVRGKEEGFRMRLKIGKYRFTRPVMVSMIFFFFLFMFTGCYIYYTTTIENKFIGKKEWMEFQRDYEVGFKKYENIPQPDIVNAKLKVEIYPENRDFAAEGIFTLKNFTSHVINEIHVQEQINQHLTTYDIQFNRKVYYNSDYKDFKFHIYTLEQPLQPGDSIDMSFRSNFVTEGFVDKKSNTRVVYNGTFFNNSYFPSIGYDSGYEIELDKDREKYGLPVVERMMARDDSIGIRSGAFGIRGHVTRLDITIGTSIDQIAIAPGYLLKEWEENNRRYFHYKMDKPIHDFYSIVSARYKVMRDNWNDVNLEIYYHPEHTYNLESMMQGMKNSLEYFSTNFGPFQYRQLRIMEFPRYSNFAQSFSNTIPFSEGIGFVMNITDNDYDAPYYVTAHEVGHQWWGHQVCEANVQGSAFLGESITQYSALMVMKQTHTTEQMQKFIRYELDNYLQGRSQEQKKEMPLELVEYQDYIHYKKGSVAMYAFQDYISEDSVNAALRRYLNDWKFKHDLYPTSADLLGYFEDVTPDSLKYLITDLFKTITLYENKTEDVKSAKVDDGFITEIEISSKKFRADTIGNETRIHLDEWIDIGVFGKDENGKDKLLHLKKYKVFDEQMVISVKTEGRPSRAGIDPLNMLIDRNPDDNVKDVRFI